MYLGWVAIGFILIGLTFLPIPKLRYAGMAIFALGLILAPIGVVLYEG